MSELNKDRILNGSPKKVLLREYANLKTDYSKMNALKYKELYEHASLSFILENSRYIFSEPMKGLPFYEEVMEKAILPYPCLLEEAEKVSSYVTELKRKIGVSKDQVALYESLQESVEARVQKEIHSASLYDVMVEGVEHVYPLYDILYEYQKDDTISLEEVEDYLKEADTDELMDVLHITERVPELQLYAYHLLEESYEDEPISPDDYQRNAFVTCTVSRMMRDSYFRESVNRMSNTNLRLVLQALGENTSSSMLEDLVYEEAKEEPIYVSPERTINKFFDDRIYDEIYEDVESKEKLLRLVCEKELVDMNLAFTRFDQMNESTILDDSFVETTLAVWEENNDAIFEYTTDSQMTVLEGFQYELENQISSLVQASLVEEKYFSDDGGPSKIVAKSIGIKHFDDKIGKKKEDKKEEEDDEEEEDKDSSVYMPHKKDDAEPLEGSDDTDDEDDDEDEDEEVKEKKKKKKKQTEKYASMSEDELDDLPSLTEAEDDTDELVKKYTKVEKPEKKNVFQRIQNKALDANVQFKKKVAEGKRTSVDAKNAAKASAKIPMTVGDQVKKTMGEWDEMDDDKRKEYIIKPGVRKKYFKALKLCILHYGAFAINPVLNVVLFITQKLSRDKDIRIRNELLRELRAEIKVTEEKIEDAKSKEDNKQKYQLMRIKEKLEAEVVRITTNSKYV